jgi:hypothetical protein
VHKKLLKPVFIIAIAVVCSVVAVLVLVPEEVPVLTAQEQHELDVIAANEKYEAEVSAFTSSNKVYLLNFRDDCNDIYKQGLKTESYYKIDQAYLEQQACLVEWKAKVFEIGGAKEKCGWFDDWNACYWLDKHHPPTMALREQEKTAAEETAKRLEEYTIQRDILYTKYQQMTLSEMNKIYDDCIYENEKSDYLCQVNANEMSRAYCSHAYLSYDECADNLVGASFGVEFEICGNESTRLTTCTENALKIIYGK